MFWHVLSVSNQPKKTSQSTSVIHQLKRSQRQKDVLFVVFWSGELSNHHRRKCEAHRMEEKVIKIVVILLEELNQDQQLLSHKQHCNFLLLHCLEVSVSQGFDVNIWVFTDGILNRRLSRIRNLTSCHPDNSGREPDSWLVSDSCSVIISDMSLINPNQEEQRVSEAWVRDYCVAYLKLSNNSWEVRSGYYVPCIRLTISLLSIHFFPVIFLIFFKLLFLALLLSCSECPKSLVFLSFLRVWGYC